MEREPIPGEREPDTLMPTDKGIVGTTGYGGDLPAKEQPYPLDDAAREEIERDAGGAPSQRKHRNAEDKKQKVG